MCVWIRLQGLGTSQESGLKGWEARKGPQGTMELGMHVCWE